MQKILLATLVISVALLLFFQLSKVTVDGSWQATLIVDNQNDTLALDLSNVKLDIKDQEYIFNSTLKRRESGRIEHTAKHLVMYPSSGKQPYKMSILFLDGAKLILAMENDGSPREMHFSSVK